MPIPLGILAAAGVRPAGAAGAYELIETITVGSGGAASVTFSNLNTYSTTYQHLQVRAVVRTNRSNVSDAMYFKINGSSSGYAFHGLTANGSNVISYGYANQPEGNINSGAAGSTISGAYGAFIFDMLDAYETNKNRVTRVMSGLATTGITLDSAMLNSTSAVNSIQFYSSGFTLVQGSRFSIYGLRGA